MEQVRTNPRIDNEQGDTGTVGIIGFHPGRTLDNAGMSTQQAEYLGAVEELIREEEQDQLWDAYLTKEWEERNDKYGFRCEFAAKALHMHGPCFVYEPNDDGELVLRDVIDPITRKSLT